MTVNVELLEQVMQHIEDHPAQHDQGVYVNPCGTAACFAGWACLLSNWQPGPTCEVDCDDVGSVISPDGLIEADPWHTAVGLLDISDADADILFAVGNTRPMLRLMVKDLANGEELRDFKDYAAEVDEGRLMITALIALTFLAAGIIIGARFKEASHGIDRLVEAHERDVDVLDAADLAQTSSDHECAL